MYAPLHPVGWDGTRYAPLQLGTLTGSQAIQPPDGTKLIVGNIVYDRVTGSATQLPFVANKGTQVMWADDSAHICVLYPRGDSSSRAVPPMSWIWLDLVGQLGSWLRLGTTRRRPPPSYARVSWRIGSTRAPSRLRFADRNGI